MRSFFWREALIIAQLTVGMQMFTFQNAYVNCVFITVDNCGGKVF